MRQRLRPAVAGLRPVDHVGMNQPKGVRTMLKEGVSQTTLPVADMDRARAFYAEKLGLTPSWEAPTGIIYETGGGTRFVLSPMAAKPAGHTQMSFVVQDLGSEVRQLKSRGLIFDEYDTPNLKTVDSIADRGVLKAAWFKDTEGNTIGVMQWVKEPTRLGKEAAAPVGS